ncbi:AAA family ATPase [Rhodovulum sp. DZ06]|uniref:AAA family ATPase n=1 Tax=Rhodovulum sp. DZ06 TaxID=3425126 RepID=UPI003D336D6B
MAEVVRLGKPEAPPQAQPGGFVMTETAAEILRSLNLVRSGANGGVTMISGAPGIGKTEALLHLCEELGAQDAVYLRVAKGEGRPWNIAYNLLNAMGFHESALSSYGSLTQRREYLARIVGKSCIVLVDEAQNLHEYDGKSRLMGAGFEWLRAMQEEGGFALAFIGDTTLSPIIADMPQLWSRMRRPLTLKSVGAGDAALLAARWGVTDAKALAALDAVARGRGSLRTVVNVLAAAADFAGGAAPDGAAIRAAILAEGLTMKGGPQASRRSR